MTMTTDILIPEPAPVVGDPLAAIAAPTDTTESPFGRYVISLVHSRELARFSAPTLAAAQDAAQSLSTILGAALMLVAIGNAESPTVYSPAARPATVAAPAGVIVE